MRTRLLLTIAVLAALPLAAQLAPPNDAGVTMGHVHMYVKSVEAQTRFWTTIMGGKAVSNENLAMIQFPGVFLIFREMEPSAPPAGSVVDHFGFVVKDLPAEIALWNANGLKVEQTGTNPNQRYVTAPDNIRLEVFGDPNLPTRVQMNHIHLFPPKQEIPAMQAWYAKTFGGVIGKRESVARPGNYIDCDDLPGVNLSMAASDNRRAPTAGRAIDHIGFEVKDLEAFARKLDAQGTKLEGPIRSVGSQRKVAFAFITDPWGTRIELTQGLASAADEAAKAEVLKASEQFDKARAAKDQPTLNRILADGLSWTARGERLSKSQVIADFLADNLHFKYFAHDNVTANVFGDTAVITGHSTSILEYKGKLFDAPRLFSDVWVKRDGRWQLLVHHVSDLAKQ